jgi:hypothetical protein
VKQTAADASRTALKIAGGAMGPEAFCADRKEQLQARFSRLRREMMLDTHCTRQSRTPLRGYLLSHLLTDLALQA